MAVGLMQFKKIIYDEDGDDFYLGAFRPDKQRRARSQRPKGPVG